MVSPSLFRRFVPTHALGAGDWAELAKVSFTGSYKPGQVLFHRGEPARTNVYLLRGSVELVSEQGVRVVAADSAEARHAIAEGARRASTGTCVSESEALFVDRDRLDLYLTWAQTGEVEVSELDPADESDWLGCLLRHPALHRIPPGNIAQILACVEQVEAEPGEVIIRQGDPGDFYYVVTAGECSVARQDPVRGEALVLGRIGPGAGFGEEALVSGEPRNATVRAESQVRLARLAAADFHRLLQEPLLARVGVKSAPADAQWIDVRTEAEYARGSLVGALNLPLRELRERATELDTELPVVAFCDTGRRSASATFLLSERGFNAAYVDGGIPVERLGG